MSQAQGMVEEEQVGGAKQKYQTVAMMVQTTILAPCGSDGPKEGILRNHCENPVEKATGNEKVGDGLFKMPRVPKKTPDKKGKAKDEGVQGDGEDGAKGKKVCA